MPNPLDFLRVSPETATAVFTGLLALTGIAAFVVAVRQLSQVQQQARIQHLLQLDRDFRSAPLTEYRSALAKKKLKGEEDPDELYRVLDFFEGIGLLVRRGYLEASDVWELFSDYVLTIYADAKGTMEDEQKSDPAYFYNLTSLVAEMQRIEIANTGRPDAPSQDDIRVFWEDEAGLLPGTTPPSRGRRPRHKQRKPAL